MCVWGYDESRGMVKTAELLVGKTAAKNLAKNLVPAPVRDVYDAIDTVGMCVSPSDYNDAYDKFEKAYTKAEGLSLLTDSDKEQMKLRMEEEEEKLEFLKEDVVNEDALS